MKKNAIVACTLLLALLAPRGAQGVVPLFPPAKASFDRAEFSEGYPPNILFLIDTGGQMLWSLNKKADRGNPDQSGCTYGHGGLTSTKVSATGRICGRVPTHATNLRDGRDVDPSNNYHTPTASRATILANSPDFYHPNLTHRISGDLSSGLMPNDSRMYKLKHALYLIFSDKDLVAGMNVGFATFWQDKLSSASYADWYKIYKGPGTKANCIYWDKSYPLPKPQTADEMYAYDYSQLVTWGVDISEQYDDKTKRARIRKWFKPASDDAHRQEIVKWFDGIETGTNDEIIADGAQPLAYSIYGVKSSYVKISNTDLDCVGSCYDFFKNSTRSPVVSYCQDNWLVVCCDGNDDTKGKGLGEDPALAVKNLYDNTGKLYVGKKLEDMNYPVRTMVIGFVDPAKEPTLAATLNKMADYGDDGKLNDSAQAYFARDTSELVRAFQDVILRVRQVSGSPSTPVVSPPRMDPQDEGAAYVPTFTTEPSDQWQGHLYKFGMDAAGNLTGKTIWEAGAKLQARSWSDRRVYTANWSASLPRDPGGSNLVRFSEGNAASLAPEIWCNVDGAADLEGKIKPLIRWTLGKNEFAKPGSPPERWKLADINRSGLFVVRKPWGTYPDASYSAFAWALRSRDARVYVQSNGGMLHAFEARSRDADGRALNHGEERWAFIPPQILAGRRILGTKVLLGSNPLDPKGGLSPSWITDGTSVPRHLLDGPLAVKDVRLKLDGKWSYRTVLLGCLGFGGKGLYALDITSPDTPRFLWAVDNANYENSGLATATPQPLHQVLWWKSLLAEEKEDGGGSGTSAMLHAFTHRTYTRASKKDPVIVDVSANLEAASPDFSLVSAYRRLGMTTSAPFIGRIPLGEEYPFVALFGGGLTGEKKGVPTTEGRGLFVVDIQSGRVLRLVSEDRWGTPLDMVSSPVYPYTSRSDGIWEGVFIPDAAGNIFKAWGKGLVSVDQIFRLDPNKSVAINQGLGAGIINGEIWLYGGTGNPEGVWNRDYNAKNYIFGVNAGGFEAAPLKKDLSHLQKLSSKDVGSTSSDPDGWYFDLTPGEYLSAAPAFTHRSAGSFVALATFCPTLDRCGTGGIGRLYIVNAKSGRGAWNSNGKKVVEISGMKISSVSFSGSKLYLTGIFSATGTNMGDGDIKGLTKNEGIAVMDIPSGMGAGDDSDSSQEVLYWRD